MSIPIYTIGFASPGPRDAEINAEDLAISEVESFICSVLAAITHRDITELANTRRAMLGQRATAIAAADWFQEPRRSASPHAAFDQLVEGARLWLQRGTLTMRESDFTRAFSLATKAGVCSGENPQHVATAELWRAKTATAQSEVCADLVAGDLAVQLATRAGARAAEAEDYDLMFEAHLTGTRAALIEADRSNTIVTNHRKFNESMQHASARLDIATNLARAGQIRSETAPSVELNLLSSRFNDCLWSSSPDGRLADLDMAIENSREAVKEAADSQLGQLYTEGCLQLYRQLEWRWHDHSPAIIAEQQGLLVNGLLNSIPMSRTAFALLLVWARFLHEADDSEDSVLGAVIRHACCQRLAKRNLALCMEATDVWACDAELLEGQAKAAAAYTIATDAARELCLRSGMEGHLGFWLAQTNSVQSFAVAALSTAGEGARAVEIADSGCSVRWQRTHSEPSELAVLAAGGELALVDDYLRARSSQQHLLAEIEDADDPVPWDQALSFGLALTEVTNQARAATDAIREQPGHANFPRRLPYSQLRAAADDAPIAYLAAGLTSGTILLLKNTRDDEPRRIDLPLLVHEALNDRSLNLRRALESVTDPFVTDGWAQELDACGEWLWKVAVERLLDATDGVDAIRLAPLGLMSFLPIHIAWTPSQNGRAYAMDTATFAYLPSAALRLRAQARPIRDGWEGLIVEGAGLDSRASELELGAAKRKVPNHVLLSNSTATPSAFAYELQRCNFAHISAHGFVNDHNPIESGFRLAEDTVIRMGDVAALNVSDLELLVLSSCESAMSATSTPDESYGFPGLFYGIAATSVIAAQWQVDQAATAALFDAFYAHWDRSHRPIDIARALRAAQLDVRDSGREHPMSWGGFTFTG